MAEQAPEIQQLIKSTQRLSKNLSIGYMAITSATDVYEDAVKGGYDRRVAGIAAISSILGQYLLMSNNKLGDWFLDTAVGYNEVASRSVISKALKPLVKEVDDAIAALPKNATSAEKLTVVRKGLNKA
jgi:hypothetical protein